MGSKLKHLNIENAQELIEKWYNVAMFKTQKGTKNIRVCLGLALQERKATKHYITISCYSN